jgi:hypothetical protein
MRETLRVVRRRGIEPAEDIRGRRCRAFEGGTDAQAVIPELEAGGPQRRIPSASFATSRGPGVGGF